MAHKDKRSPQISIPMEYPEKELKEIAKQHWNITFAKQKKVSVVAKRIMDNVLGQIHDNDLTLKPFYQMHVSEVVNYSDSGSAYDITRKAFTDLASTSWLIQDLEKKYFAPRHLLDTTKTEVKDGFETAYKDGMITIAINPVLEPYFVQVAHYTRYERGQLKNFTSWYSVRIWEILSGFEDILQKGEKWYVSLEELRGWMDCEKKYKNNTKDLLYNIFKEPLIELKGTKLEFDYDKVYAKGVKGRPPIIGLEFYLVNPQGLKPASKILEEWIEKTPEQDREKKRRCIEKGREWKISDENLVKCLPIIKEAGAWKLYKQFSEKDNARGTEKKIQDKKAFCNSAMLIAAGLKKPK
ncbi:replication initiation protein [Marivirga tractuosa]|uniref:Initiator RepB protein n=1 Tax=Marivirga tractuosa (strain ATCC 23168 / DSM 4126 / NBRC 15989 / NCIMB 1408 / VKM B-1430 / H-43) TaxID=643867 RepID=E4TW52_MARTH|nr:replication initiation protein [Marivirga tractuosa]ADR23774.1 initiator RepB protein [Marivirga tractuosa DSM 4126]